MDTYLYIYTVYIDMSSQGLLNNCFVLFITQVKQSKLAGLRHLTLIKGFVGLHGRFHQTLCAGPRLRNGNICPDCGYHMQNSMCASFF